MTEQQPAPSAKQTRPSHIDVHKKDLPLHCPTAENSLWNSHPKVFLPIEETGQAKCPYCGTEYRLTSS